METNSSTFATMAEPEQVTDSPQSDYCHRIEPTDKPKKGEPISNKNPEDAATPETDEAIGQAANPPEDGQEMMTVASVFGEIVWLMVQSPVHRHQFLVDLEWMVMTPMLLSQYRIFRVQGRPVGVAFWAYANEEVEERLRSGEQTKLAPQEWKCGDNKIIVDIAAPFGGEAEIREDTK